MVHREVDVACLQRAALSLLARRLEVGLAPRQHGRLALCELVIRELPEKDISRDPAGDARIDVSVPRVFFNALAGEPKFIFFMNRTTTAVAHQIVTVNQQQNLDAFLVSATGLADVCAKASRIPRTKAVMSWGPRLVVRFPSRTSS